MRVVIADDQSFIRRGLRAVLSEEKDIEVCAEAIDGQGRTRQVLRSLDPTL